MGRDYVYGGRFLKKDIDKDGYERVHFNCKELQINKNIPVHRLVALAFIPNENNFPVINHKNEIKTDNRVENLEWCTVKYNSTYGTSKQRCSKKLKEIGLYSIPICQYTTEGKFITEYPSIKEASRAVRGKATGNITFSCKNLGRTAFGFIWLYKQDCSKIDKAVNIYNEKRYGKESNRY